MPSGVSYFKNVYISKNSIYAFDNNNKLWSWGMSNVSQLGNETNESKMIPTAVTMPSGVSSFDEIYPIKESVYAIDNKGKMWGWGYNYYGQLGNGTTTTANIKTKVIMPEGVNSFKKLYSLTSSDHSMYAIDNNGKLWSWGSNSFGQLENGTTTTAKVPTEVTMPEGVNFFKKFYTSSNSVYAIDNNGKLWSWGSNTYGQLGNGTTTTKTIPTAVTMPDEVNSFEIIYPFERTTYAIDDKGKLWAWGQNYNAFGNGSTTNSNIPTAVTMPKEVSTFTEIYLLSTSAYAIDNNGKLWSWGSNTYGQLGNGTTTTKTIPTAVTMPEGVNSFSKFYVLGDSNSPHIYAIDNNGKLWAWGSNVGFRLGNRSSENKTIPTPVTIPEGIDIKELYKNANAYTALDSKGNIWSWGNNDHGITGYKSKNVIIPENIDVNVLINTMHLGLYSAFIKDDNNNILATGFSTGDSLKSQSEKFIQIKSLFNIKTIKSNYDTNIALDNNGKLWSWGSNTYGQLGNGTTTTAKVPTTVTKPEGVSFFTNIYTSNYNYTSVYAIDNAGKLWSWGYNNYGQLGNGTKTNKTVPTEVKMPSGATLFKEVYISSQSVYAIDYNGKLWPWGYNGNGQLGNGTKDVRYAPAKVIMPEEVSSFKKVFTSKNGITVYALDSNGRLWSWGFNDHGQLGNGTTTSSLVPAPVTMPENINSFSEIFTLNYSIYAVDNNGKLWSWGYNNYGQLGNGTTTNSLVPTPVTMPEDINSFNKIYTSNNSVYAIDNNGKLWSWGYNYYGQLGDGTTANKTVPTAIKMSEAISFKDIYLPDSSSDSFPIYAIDNNGKLWSWSYNQFGQLGNDSIKTVLEPHQIKFE